MSLSVIICTHNPKEKYLSRVIDSLRNQTLDIAHWELLIVDNKSRIPVDEQFAFSWHPSSRIIREENLGLTNARLRGIRETEGHLLVFVDDDNVLDADYLEVALQISNKKQFLGSWSGQCRPEFESKPPEWTRRYWGNLVIREFEDECWSNLPRLGETMPCGAGLVVRRDVAQRYLHLHEAGMRDFQLDRSGDSLVSGGDNDLAACACDLGYGMGIIPSLKLSHLIPPERLTLEYLSRLAEGTYFSAAILAKLRESPEELAQYKVRWYHVLRALMAPRPHRNIQLAVLRGKRKGFAVCNSLPPSRA